MYVLAAATPRHRAIRPSTGVGTIARMSRISLRITADASRQLRAGHPWLYDAAITAQSRPGDPGELAVAFDPDRRFVAIGLYDPASPIRLKVLGHGSPTTIDDEFFAARIAASIARRAPLVSRGTSTGMRLIHGENDGLPALVLDRYADVGVLKLYSPAWLPHLGLIADQIRVLTGVSTLLIRYARAVTPGVDDPRPGSAVFGSVPADPVEFLENGLRVEADVVRGQKTGYFLDQRENRARVGGMCTGRRVLDVFACTGGFSLAAAAGGAVSVHSVDLSAAALETAERLFALNRGREAVAACEHATTVGDAFAVLELLARRSTTYDLVVIDPPSFATRQSHTAAGLHAYARLTRLGLAVLRPGGLLVQSSCSSRIAADDFFHTVHRAAADVSRPLRELERTGQPVDHPVGFAQGAYLKTLFARAR